AIFTSITSSAQLEREIRMTCCRASQSAKSLLTFPEAAVIQAQFLEKTHLWVEDAPLGGAVNPDTSVFGFPAYLGLPQQRWVFHSVNVSCVIHDGLVLISIRHKHLVDDAESVKAENSPQRCVRILMCNQGHSLSK
ncbi:hypothetical protein DPX16_20441, partial [Anabarilius grahami]